MVVTTTKTSSKGTAKKRNEETRSYPTSQAPIPTPSKLPAIEKTAPTIETKATDIKAPSYNTTTKFMPNGSVEVNGNVLSRKEYEVLLGRAGEVTPNVEKLKTEAKVNQAKIGNLPTNPQEKAQVEAIIGQQKTEELKKQFEQMQVPTNPSQAVEDLGLTDVGKIGASATGGAIAGGKIGAGIGTAIAGPAGTAVGGAGGAVIGGIAGGIGSLTFSKRERVAQAKNIFLESKKNMNAIVTSVNNGGDVLVAREAWLQQIADIQYAERVLKDETSNDLNRFLSGGKDELTDVQKFYELLPIYEQKFMQASINPNKNQLIIQNEEM